jgi:PiT family inorganic phosphate transporter
VLISILLFPAACFLAYSNGANDNFKGVASLFGSGTCGYKMAIAWSTVATFAGSICSVFVAQSLLKKFTGKGLVPDALVGADFFLLAVVLGAAATVILATVTGFPVSTTHGLVGALVGAGFVAVGVRSVNFSALQVSFLLPLLISPVLAFAFAATAYFVLRFLRLRLGVTKEWCICVGERQEQIFAIPQPRSVLAIQATPPVLNVAVGEKSECVERYAGSYLGVGSQQLMDALHFLSAGVVCFARSLNDTPKIAAMLFVFKTLDIRIGTTFIAAAMAIGGLIHSRKIAETMSIKLTSMNHGQGFSANLTTGILVILATMLGLPVSMTHVSVGSLFGIGMLTRQANPRVMTNIVLSWIVTLPCAAIISGLICWLIGRH